MRCWRAARESEGGQKLCRMRNETRESNRTMVNHKKIISCHIPFIEWCPKTKLLLHCREFIDRSDQMFATVCRLSELGLHCMCHAARTQRSRYTCNLLLPSLLFLSLSYCVLSAISPYRATLLLILLFIYLFILILLHWAQLFIYSIVFPLLKYCFDLFFYIPPQWKQEADQTTYLSFVCAHIVSLRPIKMTTQTMFFVQCNDTIYTVYKAQTQRALTIRLCLSSRSNFSSTLKLIQKQLQTVWFWK